MKAVFLAQLRRRILPEELRDIATALNREIAPKVRELVDQLNALIYDNGVPVEVSEDRNLDGKERLVLVDASGGPVTITMAAPEDQRAIVTVKKVDASGNAVTVAASSGTIDGAASKALAAQYDSIRLDSDEDGDFWVI